MSAADEVLRPLDDGEVRRLAARLGELGVASVAVCLLHAHRHPEHERRVGEILREELPGLPVSLSSEILREQQEYERSATTVVNAYVRPLMERYIDAIRSGLDKRGDGAPLTIMQFSGRRGDGRRRRPPAGTRARIRAGGRRGRLALARPWARDRERDRVRHGQHDRQGVARARHDAPGTVGPAEPGSVRALRRAARRPLGQRGRERQRPAAYPPMFSTTIGSGTVYHHRMAGGGGWGDPLVRDPAAVADDVRNEKVGAASARQHYAVVLTDDGLVDEAATAKLRASRRTT